MSVIQTLRGRGSIVVTIMLILALVAFIFMDSFQNRSLAMFDADRTLVAEVNGERIETQVYTQELQDYEETVKTNQQKESLSDEEREQIRTQFWNQQLSTLLIKQESEKLGLTVSEKERNSMFTSMNADPIVKQNFTNPETGIFNPQDVISTEQQIIAGDDLARKKQWGNFKTQLVKQRKLNKYVNLVRQGIYVPKFMMDDFAAQQYNTASISYVKVPYESADAANIKITDAEIKDYLQSHAAAFMIEEDVVNLEYVSFPLIPTAKDSLISINFLNEVRENLATSQTPYDFASNQSDELTDDRFYNASTSTNTNIEQLLAAAVGDVVGPYYDNGMYKLSKITDRKTLPDSVKSSHILIQPNEGLAPEQAEARADSILKAVKAGANFEELAKKLSADQGSAQKGGDIGYASKGMGLANEYETFIFENTTGSIDVVKTQFGYHVIRVVDQKEFKPNIKVATIAKQLAPSQETASKAQQQATNFATKATDEKTFSEAAKKMGQDKRLAQNINGTQSVVPGLGNVRNLVRWAFESENGAVSPVMNFDDKIVVARITSKSKKGDLPAIAVVRPQVEAQLRKKKQFEQLANKAKSATSLAQIATMFKSEVKNADTVSMLGTPNQEISYETRVLGAAFNKNNVNKLSSAIPGQSGVFFITTKRIQDGLKTAQRIPQMEQMQLSGYKNSIEQILPTVLRKRAKITDNRNVSLNY